MTLLQSLERLSIGIEILATHPGTIKARLLVAFHRQLHGVAASLLPAHAAELWLWVWRNVTAVPAGDQDGTFAMSIDALGDEEAVAVARGICEVTRLVRVAIALTTSPDLLLEQQAFDRDAGE